MSSYPFESVAQGVIDRLEARAAAARAAAEHGVCEFCGSDDLYANTSTDHTVLVEGHYGGQSYTYHPIVCATCQKGQTWWPEEVQNPP